MLNHPRILYLFSAPLVAPDGSPLDALDMKTERDALVRELSSCKKEILLRIGYATIDEMAKSTEKFNIFYVSCHGHEEFLLFEDGKGGSQSVTGDYLKRVIQMGGLFELAIVSACHSERMGKMLVEAGIPHVIAIKSDTSVVDGAAIVFMGQFFRSLFQGHSVQKAFEMGKLVVEGNPDLMKIKRHFKLIAYKKREPFLPEEKKFVLLPKESTHSDPLLSHVPHGTVTIEEPLPSQSNLPVRPQSFMGRSVEMHAAINELLAARMVTITGVGGIGKTTLAMEVARWFCSRNYFSDGVYYIDLRQTDTAGGIIDLFGAIFGVHFSELTDIITYLRERHCLLLLDNAEDFLWQNEDALQDFVDSILKYTPHTTILVTSQRPVGGNLHEPERIYRIYPLEQEDAALLFLVTAKRRMIKNEWESDTFYSLLKQLGGHPLSIVLTARQLVPGIILGDLMKRIKVYKAKAINVKDITDTEHGESLVASLASAYDNLSENAKTLFGILSMLPAGAQEVMLIDIFGDTAWEHVQELNEASLVEIRDRRATLLPPIRLFALSVRTEKIRTHYGPKIVEILKEYTKKLYVCHTMQNAKEYRLYFTVDEPNLRSAVDLPCAPPQTVEERSALGLLGPRLIFLYFLHLRWKEAKEIGDKILSNLKRLKDQLGEADTLLMLGIIAMRTGDHEEARSKYEKALTICQHSGHERGEANMLWKLGDLNILLGDLEEARSKYEKALTIYQHIDEKKGEANVFMRLGDIIMWLDNFEEARLKYEKALTIYRHIDEKMSEAEIFRRLGDLAVQTGALEEARSKYEKALTIYQHIDEEMGEADVFIKLGQWAALTNNLDQAETNLDSAFALYGETKNLEVQAFAHMVKALLFFKHHDTIKAKRELERCSLIRDKTRAHYEATKWLILYAIHLRSQRFKEGAKICLKYAEEFAFKTRSQHLQSQIKQKLSELV
jgi:tetratricopeptide (TPR) repeat protein